MKHSPEPWSYARNERTKRDYVFDADGKSIIIWTPSCKPTFTTENAERVVACVNACRGIPNEELDKVVLNGLVFMNAMISPDWYEEALEMRK
jgi:hypothetical protein